MAYRSLVSQTLHYLARPHEEVPAGAIDSPAAWTTSTLDERQWRQSLTGDEVAELDQALAAARATKKATGALVADDFPLPTLAARIVEWREAVHKGRGFQVIRGLPVHRWSQEDAEVVFWCLGLHMGMPGAQNPAGDMVGHVHDESLANPEQVRSYRTNKDIAWHCDAADMVGLMCLRAAGSGGASRLASSVSVFNTLRQTRPDLAPRLFEPIPFDTRNDAGGLRWFPVVPCRFHGEELRTFYHADYFRSAPRHPDVPALQGIDLELLDTYEAIASDAEHCLEMSFEPGDIQLVSNHRVVHSRGAYEDDPDAPRHLLRLWVSLATPLSWRGRAGALKNRLALTARLGMERMRQRGA